MAARRRATRSPAPTGRRRRRRPGAIHLPNWRLSPDVTRSLVGIVLLVLGAVTLIALLLVGEGTLTDWWRDTVAPWFGTGRWLLPFVLLAAGIYVERARGDGWQLTLVGALVAYIGLLGIIEIVGGDPSRGGRIGHFLGESLASLVTTPGAFVVLLAVMIGGLLLMLDMSLRTLVGPVGRGARGIASVLSTSRADAGSSGRGRGGETGSARTTNGGAGRGRAVPAGGHEPESSIWAGLRGGADAGRPNIPAAEPGAAQVSSTFAPASTAIATVPSAQNGGPPSAPPGRIVGLDDVTDAGDSPPTREAREYRLPPVTLLQDVAAKNGDATMDHERNARIIVAKLASFNIPARVTRWNAGPVVTQYEVEPDPSIKVSRIEGLADDLSMALAARTIRIEAPVPGKSVVGIEIPNKDFNVVALRRVIEEVDFAAGGSKLTFALGRDVAGHARAADLSKMPHLLIAGATGSGKSVMVNALISSLLMKATPDEVRLILVDLKRVELAAYNGLPHLMVPVIQETERAKAALKWAVAEMENRYRRFAGAAARNIAAYNESRADPADRLPYIVIVVDELADLMMREGKNVEDAIVRLAQKARATGIHLVLATQRPSVNVVTGLIKANFPSRIAFAMASQIDSRTILDMPGAEDLIGRGDMLFQPADLPRPMRLQGVFVADAEITNICEHWRAEAEPHYDLAIVESDEDGSGQAEDLQDEDADRLLPDAVGVIQEYDRASASLLQRRLKIGYARAARIVDQLEARGYVGPFEGSSARQVLRREGTPSRPTGQDEGTEDR